MAEISIVNFSETLKAGRFDSEYFRPVFIESEKMVRSIDNKPLEFFVSEGYRIVYENTKIIAVDENNKDGFTRFLQASDIETPEITEESIGFVDISDWIRYKKGRIKCGELLIEVKGSAEKIAIVPEGFPEKTLVSGSLFKMTVNDKISKEFLLVYLICKYGESLKNRLKTNLLISFISKPNLYGIPVPMLPAKFQSKIEEIVKTSLENLRRSKVLYKEAERLLANELNFKIPKSFRLTFEMKLMDSFDKNRIDAEYFHPRHLETIDRIKKYDFGYDTINNIAKVIDKHSIPEAKKQYKYIELSNITGQGEISGCTFDFGENLPSRARRIVHEGDVIVSSIEGSLSSCALVTAEYDGAICSTGFYVLKPEKINPETLLVIMKSEFAQSLMKRCCSGTILTALSQSELENVVIPLIKSDTQKEIARKIKESHELRRDAKKAFEEAKEKVESEIERKS